MAVPVFASEGGLRAFFAAYVILLRRKLGFPLLLGFDNLLSHNYLPFRSNEFLICPPSNQCSDPSMQVYRRHFALFGELRVHHFTSRVRKQRRAAFLAVLQKKAILKQHRLGYTAFP